MLPPHPWQQWLGRMVPKRGTRACFSHQHAVSRNLTHPCAPVPHRPTSVGPCHSARAMNGHAVRFMATAAPPTTHPSTAARCSTAITGRNSATRTRPRLRQAPTAPRSYSPGPGCALPDPLARGARGLARTRTRHATMAAQARRHLTGSPRSSHVNVLFPRLLSAPSAPSRRSTGPRSAATAPTAAGARGPARTQQCLATLAARARRRLTGSTSTSSATGTRLRLPQVPPARRRHNIGTRSALLEITARGVRGAGMAYQRPPSPPSSTRRPRATTAARAHRRPTARPNLSRAPGTLPRPPRAPAALRRRSTVTRPATMAPTAAGARGLARIRRRPATTAARAHRGPTARPRSVRA